MIDEELNSVVKRIILSKANKDDVKSHYFENQIISSYYNIDNYTTREIIDMVNEFEIVSIGYLRNFLCNSNSGDFQFNNMTGFKVPKTGTYKVSLTMLCCESRSINNDPLTIYLDCSNGSIPRSKLIKIYKRGPNVEVSNIQFSNDNLDVYHNELLLNLDSHFWYSLYMTANDINVSSIQNDFSVDNLDDDNSNMRAFLFNERQLIVASDYSKLSVIYMG